MNLRSPFLVVFTTFLVHALTSSAYSADDRYQSHAPLRNLPALSKRPLADGPAKCVDAKLGKDENDDSEKQPWKAIQHALRPQEPKLRTVDAGKFIDSRLPDCGLQKAIDSVPRGGMLVIPRGTYL